MIYNAGNRIVNTYVYHSSVGYIMVDTGYEHSLSSVEKKLNKQGIKLSEISYVFLTHAHDDHAGFLNELPGKNTGLKVIMSDKATVAIQAFREDMIYALLFIPGDFTDCHRRKHRRCEDEKPQVAGHGIVCRDEFPDCNATRQPGCKFKKYGQKSP